MSIKSEIAAQNRAASLNDMDTFKVFMAGAKTLVSLTEAGQEFDEKFNALRLANPAAVNLAAQQVGAIT